MTPGDSSEVGSRDRLEHANVARSYEQPQPAFVFACGISGVFSNFGFRVLQAALDVLSGGCDHIRVTNVDELRTLWPRHSNRWVGITSEEPSLELSELLIASKMPLLLFHAELDEQIADFVRFGCDFPTAVHFASKRLTLTQPLWRAPTTRKLRCPPPGTPLRSFVVALTECIIANPPPDVIEATLHRLVPEFTSGDEPAIESVLEQRSDPRLVFAEKAPEALPLLNHLHCLVGCAKADAAPWTGKILWPGSLFRNPTDQNKQHLKPVDLIGAARPIVLGPHFFIPIGRYAAAADFVVERNVPANSIDLLVSCGTYTGGGQLQLSAAGSFTVEFPLVVPDACSIVEIRFRLLEGAIDGSFQLTSVRLVSKNPGD